MTDVFSVKPKLLCFSDPHFLIFSDIVRLSLASFRTSQYDYSLFYLKSVSCDGLYFSLKGINISPFSSPSVFLVHLRELIEVGEYRDRFTRVKGPVFGVERVRC